MATRTVTLLPSPTVEWGDRMHLAYRKTRAKFPKTRDPETGRAPFSYEVVATKLKSVGMEVSDQAIMRLEDTEGQDPPSRPRQRQVAYLALLAYGYDPAEFGLIAGANVNLAGFDMPKVRKALAPSFK